MNSVDVTDLVEFGLNDDEYLPLLKCVCGQTFEHWLFIIGVDPKLGSDVCPKCGRELYFTISIRVFEIKKD